jgi:hypothetical protein
MDIDMHYYGTYALARAAGIRADAARVIATAAEFVDDSTLTEVLVHPDGARFRGEPTAHHPTDLPSINDLDDQQNVWVPFHFLPGGAGSSQSQRLICTKNSAVAREMVAHHLNLADRPYALTLMGVAAHVYADTFAHYGFSGVSSRVNRIDGSTLEALNGDPLANPSVDAFFAKFGKQGGLLANFRASVSSLVGETLSGVAGDGALGHGAVATFPDQPYLEWRYAYEMPHVAGQSAVERQNVNDFEEGAAALYGMFRDFASRRTIFGDAASRVDFDDIRGTVKELVRLAKPRDQRIAAWQRAMSDGKLTRSSGEAIPEYTYRVWREQTATLKDLDRPELASAVPAYQFHQAAAVHRYYVLRDLLPHHGIYVI